MSRPPTDAILERGLANLRHTQRGAELSGARVMRRRRNWYSSTFATELVTVRTPGEERTLFCKHGEDYFDDVARLRRGPGYEAEVRDVACEVLEPDVPHSFGVFTDHHGSTYVTEFVTAATRLSESESPGAAIGVCVRLGTLHRRATSLAARAPASLNRYDGAHFERWLERLRRVDPGSWLAPLTAPLLAHGRAVIDLLSGAEMTLVHGELYPANVLVGPGTVILVDWETGGIGAGELDLAALTAGSWPEATRVSCAKSYAEARWGCRAPEAHPRALAAARLYVLSCLALRWQYTNTPPEPWLEGQFRENLDLVARST